MKVLIWDFDGTLGYREGGAWTASLWETLRQHAGDDGPSVTPDRLRPYTREGFPWQAPERPHGDLETPEAWWEAMVPVFARAYRGVGFAPPRAEALARQVRAVYLNPDRWRRTEGAAEVLAALLASGWTHVMLSNHVPELRMLLRHLELEPYFVRVFNSAEIGYEKPNRRAFEPVLDALPEGAVRWMIGDSYRSDIRGVAAVGIPGILVHRTHPEARIAFASLAEVRCFLESHASHGLDRTGC